MGKMLLCEKNEASPFYYLQWEIFNVVWIFFGGHHKIGLYLRFIFMHFRVFACNSESSYDEKKMRGPPPPPPCASNVMTTSDDTMHIFIEISSIAFYRP